MSGQDKNRDREKEEKLFRALSGVDEELLLRSEQSNDTKKQKENGKIHRFPLRYASRIAAACLSASTSAEDMPSSRPSAVSPLFRPMMCPARSLALA